MPKLTSQPQSPRLRGLGFARLGSGHLRHRLEGRQLDVARQVLAQVRGIERQDRRVAGERGVGAHRPPSACSAACACATSRFSSSRRSASCSASCRAMVASAGSARPAATRAFTVSCSTRFSRSSAPNSASRLLREVAAQPGERSVALHHLALADEQGALAGGQRLASVDARLALGRVGHLLHPPDLALGSWSRR